MAYRPLEITVLSAKGLKDVGHFSKMDVYVAVRISGDPRSEHVTPVDQDGGSDPSWNYTVNFAVDEARVQTNSLSLVFKLRHERKLLGDKDVGEIHVPVKELFDNAGNAKSPVLAEYHVRMASGKARGKLRFSYMFGAVYKNEAYVNYTHTPHNSYSPEIYPPPPVAGPYPPPPLPHTAPTAYPPPPPVGYPPLPTEPVGYGYPAYSGHPPPAGYPSMWPGYGYTAPQQQQPKRKKSGLGLGTGLVGGLIGGMLIGDMMSDSSGYEAGYDAGFDDADGF
ncbi:protein SRC2-like [Diospyros lotus]|uniref:protein SRC2-like n=1 Tax=Diospyros lotus TaxID=55363 RepID=UPI0022572F67|nr:protein SRC2-like [Diospyros lotus]